MDYGLAYFVQEGNRIRLAGVFNEAGYLGTVIAFLLCCERIDLRKHDNKILLMAGILTWSLAFYVILALYYAPRAYKKPKVMLAVLFGIAFYCLPVYNINPQIHILKPEKIAKGAYGKILRIISIRKAIMRNKIDVVVSFSHYNAMYSVIANIGINVRLIGSERNDPAQLDNRPI